MVNIFSKFFTNSLFYTRSSEEVWNPSPQGCAYGPLSVGCQDQQFCYRNLADRLEREEVPVTATGEEHIPVSDVGLSLKKFSVKKAEPAPSKTIAERATDAINGLTNSEYQWTALQCLPKIQPNMQCGFFDEAYWGVVCENGSERTNPDGSVGVNRYSCQGGQATGSIAEYTGSEGPMSGTEGVGRMNDGPATCQPCCDSHDTTCIDHPVCADEFTPFGNSLAMLPSDTTVCSQLQHGEHVYNKSGDDEEAGSGEFGSNAYIECPGSNAESDKRIVPVPNPESFEPHCVTFTEFQHIVTEQYGPKHPISRLINENSIPGALLSQVKHGMELAAAGTSELCLSSTGTGSAVPASKVESKKEEVADKEVEPEKPSEHPESQGNAEELGTGQKANAEAVPNTQEPSRQDADAQKALDVTGGNFVKTQSLKAPPKGSDAPKSQDTMMSNVMELGKSKPETVKESASANPPVVEEEPEKFDKFYPNLLSRPAETKVVKPMFIFKKQVTKK